MSEDFKHKIHTHAILVGYDLCIGSLLLATHAAWFHDVQMMDMVSESNPNTIRLGDFHIALQQNLNVLGSPQLACYGLHPLNNNNNNE